LTELDSLRPHLDGIPLAVELRNRDWVTGDHLDDTLCWFRERRITFVLVDAPVSEHFTIMPGIDCVTNPALGYFRFHGRNEQGYIRGRSVAERFDYDYSDEEVKELAERIRKVALEVEELRRHCQQQSLQLRATPGRTACEASESRTGSSRTNLERNRGENGNDSKRCSNSRIQWVLTFRSCRFRNSAAPAVESVHEVTVFVARILISGTQVVCVNEVFVITRYM
jgi:hypothetical protein